MAVIGTEPCRCHQQHPQDRQGQFNLIACVGADWGVTCRTRADDHVDCRLNPVSEGGGVEEDDKNTMRLVEGISHPSRAEDVQDLHRLQKSSTKPRQGTQVKAVYRSEYMHLAHAVLMCYLLLQMMPARLPLFPRPLDQAPGRELHQAVMLA